MAYIDVLKSKSCTKGVCHIHVCDGQRQRFSSIDDMGGVDRVNHDTLDVDGTRIKAWEMSSSMVTILSSGSHTNNRLSKSTTMGEMANQPPLTDQMWPRLKHQPSTLLARD